MTMSARMKAITALATGLRLSSSTSAMTIASHGEERPLVPTEDGVREVQNRRVEIIVVR